MLSFSRMRQHSCLSISQGVSSCPFQEQYVRCQTRPVTQQLFPLPLPEIFDRSVRSAASQHSRLGGDPCLMLKIDIRKANVRSSFEKNTATNSAGCEKELYSIILLYKQKEKQIQALIPFNQSITQVQPKQVTN